MSEKKALEELKEWFENKNGVIKNKYFQRGLLKRHLIIEAGSKISNKLKIISGKDTVESIEDLNIVINQLKYKLVEHGLVALVKDDKKGQLYCAKVIEYDNFGTNKLQYLKIQKETVNTKEGDFIIELEYKIDPRTPKLTRYIVKTTATNFKTGDIISLEKLNKLLGRKFYSQWSVLKTAYIPSVVFKNSYDGVSDIEGLEEIFLLERQLLKEIPRDLDLSRKKILYKTRLARKTKGDLELEMTNDSIVVFEDGNAVFTSPIDLWAPGLIVKQITEAIDWLVNYTLKMKFAAKDSMATGAQKTDEQMSEINQSSQNYLEDKQEMWSIYMNKFINKCYKSTDKVEVEFQLMTTINRLVNNGTPKGGGE